MKFSSSSAALLLVASSSGFAANLQISQIADQGQELQVFYRMENSNAPAAAAPTMRAWLDQLALAPVETTQAAVAAPVTVVVAIDTSRSMSSVYFAEMLVSLAGTLETLPAGSQVALQTIASSMQTRVAFGPASAVVAALPTLRPDSPSTSLSEGIIEAQRMNDTAAGPPSRRFVLLITDGLYDEAPTVSAEELLKKLRQGRSPIFAAVLAKSQGKQPLEKLGVLSQVMRASGGKLLVLREPVDDGLQELLRTAMDTRVASFNCAACQRDGHVHVLTMESSAGDAILKEQRELILLPLAAGTQPNGATEIALGSEAPRPVSAGWAQSKGLLSVFGAFVLGIGVAVVWSRRRR
jgi:Mg-chelatase subunit ChlD